MMFGIVISLLCMWTTLAVNRPPNITLQPMNRTIYFMPGRSAEILCEADGFPKPTVKVDCRQIFKPGQLSVAHGRVRISSSLRVNNFQPKAAYLSTVRGCQEFPRRYTWKRNGEEFMPFVQDDRIVRLPNVGTIVFNITENRDEGIFQCFADNGYGISVSDKIHFKEAKLMDFKYERRLTHIVAEGNHLTLPCTPPRSYPQADVFWVLREPDGRWQAININKRFSKDMEGRLHFTNIKKSDEQGGRAYSCIVINYFMRDNVLGPEHVVKVTGLKEQKHPAIEMWTSPSDQIFLRGGIIRLKCIFSGNPTPDVYWEKLGGTFPDRASFRSFGLELVITEVEESDAGQYECMGLNTESTQRATKAFDIRIESAPYWDVEPTYMEMSINEKATFICKANGYPQPQYSWYINGIPLEDSKDEIGVRDPRIYNNKRFFKPDANNITLTNLTLEDHMNIQCNASNKHGYVFADVYLNVLDKKPKIIKQPLALVKVTENKSVTIDCLVTGHQDPNVTWYRDNISVTGERLHIMPNGSLHIQKVEMADAGDYRCKATNSYGTDTSSTCELQVIRNTSNKQCPTDSGATAGHDAMLVCSGSADFDEAANIVILWNFLFLLFSSFILQ